MTITQEPSAAPSRRPLSLHGILTIAKLELTQRIRDSRWPWILAVWVGLIALVTVTSHAALNDPTIKAGPQLYDITTFMVLALGMLVVPALTATSVNGDREHGVLATLQTTLLTPGEIVVGKLVAAWAIAMVFLATAVPFLIWAWFEGGVSVASVLLAVLVMAVVLAVICALGLWFSTVVARPVLSTALTYLALAALVFGTLFTFGVTLPLATERETVQVYGVPESEYLDEGFDANNTPPCRSFTRVDEVAHTERTWWLLAANPFVVVADAASSIDRRAVTEYESGLRPLQAISEGVRMAKDGPRTGERNECWQQSQTPPTAARSGPVWPYGLGLLTLLGAAGTAASARNVRMPVRRLARGTRIA